MPGRSAIPDDLFRRLVAAHRSLLVSRLAAPAAHEIINPVSASVNLASLLQHIVKEDGIPTSRLTECREYLHLIAAESARAGRYASELLAFSRASSRKPGRIYVNELARQTQSLVSHLLKMEGIALDADYCNDAGSVQGDATEVQQALLNVIFNAVEAMEGLQDGRIRMEVRNTGRGISILVHDTGLGIAPDVLPRIFDPFFTTRNRPENLGLGLTIARSVLERHRGKLEIESAPGQGTTASLNLPTTEES